MAFPHTTFVVLSDQDDRASILACLEAGGAGYILTSSSPDQSVRALDHSDGRAVRAGALSVTRSIRRCRAYRPELKNEPRAGTSDRASAQCSSLLAEGCATKPFARRLDLAVGTVKVHLAAIYRTLARRAVWKRSRRRIALTRRCSTARKRPARTPALPFYHGRR